MVHRREFSLVHILPVPWRLLTHQVCPRMLIFCGGVLFNGGENI
jgi:hypothetical protein